MWYHWSAHGNEFKCFSTCSFVYFMQNNFYMPTISQPILEATAYDCNLLAWCRIKNEKIKHKGGILKLSGNSRMSAIPDKIDEWWNLICV